MTPHHLYVHAPFCARRCSYCDFAVHVDRRPRVDAWVRAISSELGWQAERIGWTQPQSLRTLYVGGGTPSLLGADAMRALRHALRRFVMQVEDEWTVEANPESFDAELAAGWKEAGVGRVSLGVQTFHEPALRWMGRLHAPDGPGRAMAAARRAGIEDVSVDLIFALPSELGRDWRADLERALALEPDHVSLYGLTAEPGAALGRWVREGRSRLPDDDRYAEEYELAVEMLTSEGFKHYEVSNFARPGRRSRHNSAYWTGAAYLGLGPGAHSFLPPARSWNIRDWLAYSDALGRGASPVEERETLDAAQLRLERVWLGLRHDGGFDVQGELSRGSNGAADDGVVVPQPLSELLDRWDAAGWLHSPRPVRLTAAGWLLLDRLALELDDALARSCEVDALPGRRTHSARPEGMQA